MRRIINYLRNRILRSFDNVNIKNKLIIGNVICVFLPVILVGVLLTNGLRQMAVQNATEELNSNMDRIETRVKQALTIPTKISNEISSDYKLYTIINSRYKNALDCFRAMRDYPVFQNYMDYNQELSRIRFYHNNETLFDDWRFIKLNRNIKAKSWYKDALKNQGRITWGYVYDNAYDEAHVGRYLSLIRSARYVNNKHFGVIVISIDKDYLNTIVEQEPLETMMIDEKGNIVLATNRELEGKKVNTLKISAKVINRQKNGVVEAKYNNRLSEVIIRDFTADESRSKFKIISISPMDKILKAANQKSLMGFIIIIFGLCISILLILFFSNAIGARIKKLSSFMKKVFIEDFNVDVVSGISGKDEIGQLADDINTMIKNLRTLVYEVYEMDLQKKQLSLSQKEIQLKMLASQINPHFLYNALETIRMRAYVNGDGEVANIVKQFSKIMRRNLEVSNGAVLIEAEIDLVRSYLEIQKFIFGSHRMDYEINIRGDISGYTILPLIVQPIVENAIVHGIEDKEEGGKITIDVEKSEKGINIIVSDNGIGIDKNRLNELISNLSNEENTIRKRIGINNIYQRIKLYYGEDWGLGIRSELGEGTKVNIFLPLVRGEKNV